MRQPHLAIRLDENDRALLDACAKKENLSKSDVLRRGLHLFAKQLKVAVKPKKQAPPKPASLQDLNKATRARTGYSMRRPGGF